MKGFPSQPWHKEIGGCGCNGCQAHARIYIWCKMTNEKEAIKHTQWFMSDESYDETAHDNVAKRIEMEDKLNGPHGYALYKMMLAKRKAK